MIIDFWTDRSGVNSVDPDAQNYKEANAFTCRFQNSLILILDWYEPSTADLPVSSPIRSEKNEENVGMIVEN